MMKYPANGSFSAPFAAFCRFRARPVIQGRVLGGTAAALDQRGSQRPVSSAAVPVVAVASVAARCFHSDVSPATRPAKALEYRRVLTRNAGRAVVLLLSAAIVLAWIGPWLVDAFTTCAIAPPAASFGIAVHPDDVPASR